MITPSRTAPPQATVSARGHSGLNWALSVLFSISLVGVLFYSIMSLYPLVFELK